MKIASSKDNIIFLKAATQYELSATFLRLQEFYESPKFRNQIIDLEEYMDWYAEEYGNFTYMSDHCGFNVPGHVVRIFFEKHKDILFQKEKALYELLKEWIEGKDRFYVIGIWKHDNTLDHEYSHAFFHLDTSYKAQQIVALKEVPEKFRVKVYNYLETNGHHASVFDDETVAYLATNTMSDMVQAFNEDIPWNAIAPMQVIFDKFYTKYKEVKKNGRIIK